MIMKGIQMLLSSPQFSSFNNRYDETVNKIKHGTEWYSPWINRIIHQSLMQTEKFQSEDKRIIPETRFTSFPALSVDPRV